MATPRVLHLASWFPSAAEPTLGNFVLRHLEALATQIPVTVIATAQGAPGIEDSKNGNLRIVRVFYQKKAPFYSKYKAYFKGYHFLLSRGERFDLLHVHVTYPAAAAARSMGLPYLITEHFSGFQPERNYQWGLFEKKLTRWGLKKAAMLLPVSEGLGQAMQSFGYRGAVKPISNVVNTEIFNFLGKTRNNRPKRFLHISTLQNGTKNITGLLDGFALLAEKSSDFELAIGGDGDTEWLRQEIAARNLPQLEILQEMAQSEVAHQMQKADCFVLFSHIESQGVVLLESLCCGTPVIGPKVGGVPEIVSPERGILVEPNQPAQLCRALQQMLEGFEFNAHEIAQKAKAQYGQAAIAQKFKEAYASVLRSSASGH